MLAKEWFIETFWADFRERSPGPRVLGKSDQSTRKQSYSNFYATVPLALHLTLWIKTHKSLTNNPQNLSS